MRQRHPAELTLVDADTMLVVRPVNPSHSSPVLCKQWEITAPAVREAGIADRDGQDGVWDATSYTGAGTATLDLTVFGGSASLTGDPADARDFTAYDLVERLTAMAHPGRRPWLFLRRYDEGQQRYETETWRVLLRGTPFSVAYGRKAGAYLELSLSFTTPQGYLESPLREAIGVPVVSGGTAGAAFPMVFPLTFGAGESSGATVQAAVAGSVPVAPTLYVYGPVTGPDVRLDSGERFYLPGLSIASGQFLMIDMESGAVLLDGSPSASVYHLVDWSVSTFWRLRPGLTNVRYLGGGGQLTIQWRDRRYTI